MTAGADVAPALARPALRAREVFAAVLGNGFEFFDFTVYATFLGLIGQAFFPSDNAAGERSGVGRHLRRRLRREAAWRRPHRRLWRPGRAQAGDDPLHRTDGDRQRHHRVHARLPDDWRPGADAPDRRAPLSRIRGRRRSGARDHVLARGRAGGSAHAFCELAACEPEPEQPARRLDWPPAGVGAVPIEPERLGLARSLRVRDPDRPGRHLHSQPAGGDSRKAVAENPRVARPRFSPRSFDPTGAACCSVSPSSAGARSPSIF